MSFTANHIEGVNSTQVKLTQTKQTPNQLNSKELEVLLTLIKRSSFLGEDVEAIYTMVVKLQNQYLEQTK
jgi:endonuclease III